MNQPPPLSNAATTGRILLVDDDDVLRASVQRLLRRRHEVVEAADGGAALEALKAGTFDAVLSDIHMPGIGGMQMLRAIREADLDVPVILITGQPNVETAVRAVEYGALEYLVKPVPLERLEASVTRAIQLGRLARLKRAAFEASGGERFGGGDHAGLEASFERALETMWPAFQPIVDRTGALYGHEVLMRADEPTLPHPGAILEAADRLGRILEIGRRMRALAARDAADLATGGILFVNLHSLDLEDASLFSAEAPLDPFASRIVLELTERMSLDGVKDPKARISDLRARGYRIAVDDLGAGYAGLDTFALVEPEVVKLDLGLVRDVDASEKKQKVIRSMTSLCHDLGALVVAECIETPAELRTLLDLGCDLFQGYLIGRPGRPFPTRSWLQD